MLIQYYLLAILMVSYRKVKIGMNWLRKIGIAISRVFLSKYHTGDIPPCVFI